ncbi:nonsense-mediated mRNA decay factor SMG9-like isoform X2 [Rhopilema esculentum]|uniref:nonsense-mediated mRNA decay factor SMG9-like isoform X2 n=1 Tax=Rhopilema esculentum TaxID=499914 RepID=UPI0031D11329
MDDNIGRGKSREEDGRDRRGERRDRGGRKRERRGRDSRDKDRGKRMERSRPSPMEKQDSTPQASAPMKQPIILTKPMAEKVLQEAQSKEAQGKEQHPVVIAIQKSGTSRPSTIDSTKSQSQTLDSLSRREERSEQGKAQMVTSSQTSSTAQKLDQVVTGLAALHATPRVTMKHSSKVVDDSFYWSDKCLTSLLEQTDFVVVGVVGYQGVGKSTILSMLGDSKNEDALKSGLLFRSQSKQDVEKSLHRTEGIDMFVTPERLIFLDTQPLMSPSILDRFLRHERKVPSDFGTAETCVEMQSLQILTFLFAVCHVVLVVTDHFSDNSLLKLLKTAEMLKPSTVAHSGQEGSSASNAENLDEYFPHIVLVHNRCDHKMFDAKQLNHVCQTVDKFFGQSRLKLRGSASIIRTEILPCAKLKLLSDFQDLNIFMLPEYDERESQDPKLLVTTYRGHPSFSLLVSALRHQLLSIPRQHLTHHPLTERSWFHYAARTWDSIKKSPLLSEYQRLLAT